MKEEHAGKKKTATRGPYVTEHVGVRLVWNFCYTFKRKEDLDGGDEKRVHDRRNVRSLGRCLPLTPA